MNVVQALEHHGIKIHFAVEGFDSMDPKVRSLLALIPAVDEGYLSALRDKVRGGMQMKLQRGYSAGGRHYSGDM